MPHINIRDKNGKLIEVWQHEVEINQGMILMIKQEPHVVQGVAKRNRHVEVNVEPAKMITK